VFSLSGGDVSGVRAGANLDEAGAALTKENHFPRQGWDFLRQENRFPPNACKSFAVAVSGTHKFMGIAGGSPVGTVFAMPSASPFSVVSRVVFDAERTFRQRGREL
jgi:hypothetical protein